MKSTITKVLLWALLCFGVSVSACAQIFGLLGLDPALKWQTLETEHFRIHFHQGLEGVAHEAALIAEESYGTIKAEFAQAPEKLDIFILDGFDFSNGFANPFADQVGIFTSQYRLSDWANVRLDSWWRLVLFHELVHAIEMDQTRGISQLLRRVFGKVVLPNFLKPIPFIEGLAVYEKFKHLKESRLNDSRTRMMIRQMVLDNQIPRFDEIKGFYSRSTWPALGLLVYNYGSWLMRYIEETHGPDAMKKFDEVNAKRPLNLLAFLGFGEDLDKVTRAAYGLSADELYQGFRDWLRSQFNDEIQRIHEEGTTKAIRVTTLGFVTGQPSWSPDGRRLVYRHSGPSQSGLRLATPQGEEDHELIAGGAMFPAWAPDSHALLYAKLDFDGFYSIKSDLYRYDLKTQKEERLTWGERAYYARFSPDGQRIYYAKNIGHDGSTALAVLDLKTHLSRTIKEFPDNTGILHSFSLSPDGTQIALALWRRGGFQDIYLMPAAGGELTPITQDKNQDADPLWSPDGQYILFSSDPGRVYNLYAYNISDGKFFKITNSMTGAFYPTISPDSHEIAFASYSSQGYDVYRMPYNPQDWQPVELPQDSIPAWPGYPTTQYPIRPYHPLPLMLPKFWLPIPWPGGLGVVTAGFDPLFKHFYSALAGWDFENNEPLYSLSYTNNEFFPLTLFASQDHSGAHQGVNATVPLALSIQRQQLVSLSYQRAERRPAKEEKAEEESEKSGPGPSLVHRISSSYSFSQQKQRESFRDDLEISATAEMFTKEGSGRWHNKLVFQWREGFRLPLSEPHRISVRFAAGWTNAQEKQEQFQLGGPDGRFVLRGFEAGALRGRQAISAGVQYDLLLFSIERGVGHWPFFVDDLRLNLFLDAGMAGDTLNLEELKLGFGAELSLSVVFGYYQSMALIAGVAQGVGEAQPVFYLNASLPQLF